MATGEVVAGRVAAGVVVGYLKVTMADDETTPAAEETGTTPAAEETGVEP